MLCHAARAVAPVIPLKITTAKPNHAGEDAYQPATYGRTITVERRIAVSGSSTWKLSDQDGRPVTLSGLRGAPVVLYFYPRDNTPGCTVEAENFRDAAVTLREAPKRKRKGGLGRLLLLGLIGGGVALAASEGLRKKVLDALFGAEEEFEYTSPTSAPPSSPQTAGTTT